MGKKSAYKQLGNLKEIYERDLGIDRRIILKRILEKQVVRKQASLIWH
jgi:hypothetical protein